MYLAYVKDNLRIKSRTIIDGLAEKKFCLVFIIYYMYY